MSHGKSLSVNLRDDSPCWAKVGQELWPSWAVWVLLGPGSLGTLGSDSYMIILTRRSGSSQQQLLLLLGMGRLLLLRLLVLVLMLLGVADADEVKGGW